MEMVFHSVAMLKHDWRAWIVAALIALKALHALYYLLRCPVACGRYEPTTEEIAAARAFRFQPTKSFIALMFLGIAMAIGGLYTLGSERYGPLGLALLVLGVFMFTSEPNRLNVQGAMREVIATTGGEGDSNMLARDNLRSAHRTRALLEIIIAAVVIALLYTL